MSPEIERNRKSRGARWGRAFALVLATSAWAVVRGHYWVVPFTAAGLIGLAYSAMVYARDRFGEAHPIHRISMGGMALGVASGEVWMWAELREFGTAHAGSIEALFGFVAVLVLALVALFLVRATCWNSKRLYSFMSRYFSPDGENFN